MIERSSAEEMDCNHAKVSFATHGEAPLIDMETIAIFPKLQGKGHENKGRRKEAHGYFLVDDVEYAARFAKAFQHAVELCGGKPESF